MIAIVANHPIAFLLAWIVHILIGVFVVTTFDWTAQPVLFQSQENVINAMVISEPAIMSEVVKLEALEKQKQQAEQQRIRAVEAQVNEAKKAREKELKKLAQLEAERKMVAKKKREADKARKVAEAAALKAQQDIQIADRARQKVLQEKQAAEEKRHIAQEKKRQAEQKAKAAEQKRLAAQREIERVEKEQQRKALAQQRREEEAAQRAAMLNEEQARISQAQEQENQDIIKKYTGLIKGKIESQWRKPPTMSADFKCTILVQILPGGLVRSAVASRDCGNKLARRSAEQAVRTAEPLPLPKAISLFPKFKELKLIFKPTKR